MGISLRGSTTRKRASKPLLKSCATSAAHYIGRLGAWSSTMMPPTTCYKTLSWSSIDHFRGDARLSTWLYKIAVNETLTYIARERARNEVSIDSDDAFLVNDLAADPNFDGNELQLKLQQAINTLPEKQRLVFNMRYFDDMRYEDMSEILGTSVGALKSSYHHALKKIEQFFSDND